MNTSKLNSDTIKGSYQHNCIVQTYGTDYYLLLDYMYIVFLRKDVSSLVYIYFVEYGIHPHPWSARITGYYCTVVSYWFYLHVSANRDLECDARSDGVDVAERPRVGLPKALSACRVDNSRNKAILFLPDIERIDADLMSRPPSPQQRHNWSLSGGDPALSLTLLSSSTPITSLQLAEGRFGAARVQVACQMFAAACCRSFKRAKEGRLLWTTKLGLV